MLISFNLIQVEGKLVHYSHKFRRKLSYLIFSYLQTEFKRIASPLKYQTRCVTAFPDKQGFLVRNSITFCLLILSVKRSLVCFQNLN